MPNYTTPDDLILQERDDLNYFLGNPPSWMLRNGIMVVAFVFGLLLWLSYLIKYPDTVACRVVLTTEHPPIRVLAQASGRVAELLVKENEVVEVGKILCALENTAEWRDVLRLESLLLNNNTPLSILAQNGLKLGSLQTIYSTFTQNAKDFSYFVNNNGVAIKTQHLQNQIASLRALYVLLCREVLVQGAEGSDLVLEVLRFGGNAVVVDKIRKILSILGKCGINGL